LFLLRGAALRSEKVLEVFVVRNLAALYKLWEVEVELLHSPCKKINVTEALFG